MNSLQGRAMSRGIFSLVLIAAVCLGVSAPALAQSDSPAMQELIKAAQAEGRVEVLLSGQVPQRLPPVMPLFEKKYGIKVNFQTGGGEQNGQRLLAERRVNRFTLDIWLGGANTALVQLIPNGALAPIPALLADPEVKNLTKWYQNHHFYVDPDQRYVFAFGAQPMQNIAFNTELVKPEQITSYHDLLDPKWKGKIVSWNPSVEGAGPNAIGMYLNPKIGEEWFVRWARDMQVTIVEDARQGAEWVALGRFPIGMFGMPTQAEKLQQEGFPIQGYIPHSMAEGDILNNSATNIMIMDRAPHPKAAQLFLNWVLSQEAQQAIVKTSGVSDSLRTDIDNSVIPPQYRRDPHADYYVVFADQRYQSQQTELMDRIRKIMKNAGYN
jgi:iron(III) transport system substrate-binding protein